MYKIANKKELKEKVLQDFLFGQDHEYPLKVYEAIITSEILENGLTIDGNIFQYNYDLSIKKKNKRDGYKKFINFPGRKLTVLDNNRENVNSSKQSVSIEPFSGLDKIFVCNAEKSILNQNEQHCEKEIYNTQTSFNLETEKKYLLNVIFTGCYTAPIVRIFEIFDKAAQEIELTVKDEIEIVVGIEYLFKKQPPTNTSLELVVDSTKSTLNYNKVVTTSTINKYRQEDIKNKLEYLYASSSIDKETVVLDENGDLKEYKNPLNNIQANIEYLSEDKKSFKYTVNVLGTKEVESIPIYEKTIICSENGELEECTDTFLTNQIKVIGGQKNRNFEYGLHDIAIYDNFIARKRIIKDLVTGKIDSYDLSEIAEIRRPTQAMFYLQERRLNFSGNEERIVIPFNEKNANRSGIIERKFGNVDFKCYIICKEDSTIEFCFAILRIKNEIMFNYLNKEYIDHDCMDLNIGQNRYQEEFSSRSGIKFNCLSYGYGTMYKDNDVEVNIDHCLTIKSEIFRDIEDYFYKRDMFGVPFKTIS